MHFSQTLTRGNCRIDFTASKVLLPILHIYYSIICVYSYTGILAYGSDDALLIARALELGIAVGTTVIVYSSKCVFAARLWWILKYDFLIWNCDCIAR